MNCPEVGNDISCRRRSSHGDKHISRVHRSSYHTDITELSHQLEAANMYMIESGLGRTSSINRSRLSNGSRQSDVSVSSGNYRLSNTSGLSSIQENGHETLQQSVNEDIDSEEEYITEFANRCAEYPGRKPLLMDIRNTMTVTQKPQFPIILNQAFEKLNSNQRNENCLSPALYHALLAGTCKSIITENDYKTNDLVLSSHSSNGKDYIHDESFPSFLHSLSCFNTLSLMQIHRLIDLFVAIPFTSHEVLVKEEEFIDHMIIVLEGRIQKIKYSVLDGHYYPYGVLNAGCVHLTANLLNPSYATYSLFSLTDGLYISLSQNDYMSVISLRNLEEYDETKNNQNYICSLNVKPVEDMSVVKDPLYDVVNMNTVVRTSVDQEISHNLYKEIDEDSSIAVNKELDLFAKEALRLRTIYQNDSISYHRIIAIISSIYEYGDEHSVIDRFCHCLKDEMNLSGITLYSNSDNQLLMKLVITCEVGVTVDVDTSAQVNKNYFTVVEYGILDLITSSTIFYENINIPIYVDGELFGLIHIRRVTKSVDMSVITNEEINMIQNIASSIPSFPQLLIQSNDTLCFDCNDDEKLSFFIDSISLHRVTSSQLLYTTNSIKFAAFQNSMCVSDYKTLLIPSCECTSINKILRDVCGSCDMSYGIINRRVNSMIRINRCNMNTVLIVKLVLGSFSVIGLIPIYGSDGFLISGKRTVSLFDEKHFDLMIPIQYRRNDSIGEVVLSFDKRLMPIRYGYVHRHLPNTEWNDVEADSAEAVKKLVSKNAVDPLSDGEKVLISKYCMLLQANPHLSLLLADSINYVNPTDCSKVYSVMPTLLLSLRLNNSPALIETGDLNKHNQVVGEYFLLLGRRDCDVTIRQMVVQNIESLFSDVEYVLYCSQLVQALKWDLYDNNALIRLLLMKAIRIREFAYVLYWQLQSNCSYSMYHSRFGRYLNTLLSVTDTLKIVVGSECILVNQLMSIAEKIKHVGSHEERNVTGLQSLLKEMSIASTFSLPLYSGLQLSSINLKKCRVMSSKKLPLFLSFDVNKHSKMNSILGGSRVNGKSCFNVLVKKGDDIRKDQLIVAIIRILGDVLEGNGYTNRFQYYSCLSTAADEGLLEIVDDSVTIGEIYNDNNNMVNSLDKSRNEHGWINRINTAKRVLIHNFAIQEYLITNSSITNNSVQIIRKRYADLARLQAPRVLRPISAKQVIEQSEDRSVEAISRRFAESLGQYMMFIYIFGIGDRHNDNVMINSNGLFHIDFGHILGHYKSKLGFKRETHSFLFTRAYYNALGGENHPYFKLFMDYAIGTYNSIRSNYLLFFSLFEMMQGGGVDEIAGDNDTKFFYDSCRLDLSEDEAISFMKAEIMKSVDAKLPVINDFFHVLRHA